MDELEDKCEIAALKKGRQGSVVVSNGKRYEIPAVTVELKNLNGAGDGYAAGFLYQYLRMKSPLECGLYASEVASKVIAIEAPHL